MSFASSEYSGWECVCDEGGEESGVDGGEVGDIVSAEGLSEGTDANSDEASLEAADGCDGTEELTIFRADPGLNATEHRGIGAVGIGDEVTH